MVTINKLLINYYKLIRRFLQDSKFIHKKLNTSLMFEINPTIFYDFTPFIEQLSIHERNLAVLNP